MASPRFAAGTSLTGSPSSRSSPAVIGSRPGDHAQQRRLPAARRPDEDDELAVVDVKVEALNDLQIAEMLDDAVEVEARHQTASFAFGISQPP